MVLLAMTFYIFFFWVCGTLIMWGILSLYPPHPEMVSRNFSNFWVATFLGASSFHNVGLTLTSDSLISYIRQPGTQFTCFTSTKVKILIPEELRSRGVLMGWHISHCWPHWNANNSAVLAENNVDSVAVFSEDFRWECAEVNAEISATHHLRPF